MKVSIDIVAVMVEVIYLSFTNLRKYRSLENWEVSFLLVHKCFLKEVYILTDLCVKYLTED